MLECLVLGDSIASGVGQARPECETVARVGITSGAYINELFPLASRTAQSAVISLGVNDDVSVDTIENLRLVRRSLRVPNVVWLLPGLKENVRQAIRTVARENGDQLVETRPYVGPDHLHPSGAGYRIIAEQTIAPGEVQVAYDEPPRVAYGRQRVTVTSIPLAGNLARYRVNYIAHGPVVHTPSGSGKVQQMSDMRHALAHQQAGARQQGSGRQTDGRQQAGNTHQTAYAAWPPPHATYAALPPPSYAYRAFIPPGRR